MISSVQPSSSSPSFLAAVLPQLSWFGGGVRDCTLCPRALRPIDGRSGDKSKTHGQFQPPARPPLSVSPLAASAADPVSPRLLGLQDSGKHSGLRMPRASGSAKRQHGAAHRDLPRHDSALVGSGKRGPSSKSLAHVNGTAKLPDTGPSHPAPQPPPLPPPPNGFTDSVNVRKLPDDDVAASSCSLPLECSAGHAFPRVSLDTYSETSESAHSAMATHGGPSQVDGGYRLIDVNAMKNADVHRDSGPLDLAATVVRSLPIQDTLSLLIILMRIPYEALTVVYAGFASLTFVPPVVSKAGWNINKGEILDANSYTPSLAIITCLNFFFFLVWVFLWPPIQDFVLEFAKPVIAVTVGGRTSPRDGASRGVGACFAWVLAHKLFRASESYWPRFAHHVPDAWRMPAMLGASFSVMPTTTNVSDSDNARFNKRGTHGWIQSVLAMHILTQGIVRYVREWYLQRERRPSAVAGPGDPEAAKSFGSSVTGGANGLSVANSGDSSHDANPNALDSDFLTPHGAHAGIMAKKKRKQSAQVRLQQPLWAALASTKIVLAKDLGVSSWSWGKAGKQDIHCPENAPTFDRQPRHIWISYIGSDEVCFSTSCFPACDDDVLSSKTTGHATRPAGVDTSKPFYVKINNTFWQPTRILGFDTSGEDEPLGQRWTGDIYGLRPASKYVCEFVDMRTDHVLFKTSIRTTKETQCDSEASPSGQPQGQQPLRSDSPVTTLRTSIEASEGKLLEEKTRLKTWRKDWKARINSLKKDNELADSQLSSAGNSDEKLKQKIRQQETQKAQAVRDMQRLSEQFKAIDATPESAERKKAERAYSMEKKMFEAAQSQMRECKTQLENKIKAKEVDKANFNSRQNKTGTRIAKVENELANLVDANSRGLGEVEWRKQERAKWLEQAKVVEHNLAEHIGHYITTNTKRREQLRTLEGRMRSIQGYMSPANLEVNSVGAPETGHASLQQPSPWNAHPNVSPHYSAAFWTKSPNEVAPAVPAPSQPFNTTTWHPLAPTVAREPRGSRARGRSSSMLSDVIGFTHLSDEDSVSPPAGTRRHPQPPTRRRDEASGSGYSSANGSVGDPMSPA